MASGIYENDWILSTGVRPWHGIGTVVKDAPTSIDAIRIAKLDWDVEQFPIYADGQEVPGYFANVRTDTKEALGVVKSRYRIVQNNEAFDFVDAIVGGNDIECRYETAGSLFNGRRIFLLVKLPNMNLLGDDIENYLFFTNTHDGTSSLTAGISNVRVVCNNTLQLAMRNAARTWKCRHTISIEDKKKEAQSALGMAVEYMDTMKDTATEMARKLINEEQFFRTLYERNPTHIADKNKMRTFSTIMDIYHGKDDLQNFKGTAWGLYNAVADFVSNTDAFRTTDTFAENKLKGFFDGYKLLEESQKILASA